MSKRETWVDDYAGVNCDDELATTKTEAPERIWISESKDAWTHGSWVVDEVESEGVEYVRADLARIAAAIRALPPVARVPVEEKSK